MFTWICPQCGREVPPAYNDCPDCAQRAAAAANPAPPQETAEAPRSVPPPPPPPPPQAPQYSAPQPPPPQQQPVYQASSPLLGQVRVAPYQPAPAPPARAGLPTWLMTIVFALAFLGLGAGIYWGVGYLRGTGTPTPSVSVESPAAKPNARVSPYQKYIEITGVRFTEDKKKKPEVRFIVVNHAGADIPGLAGNVTIWGRTNKSEEDAAGTFSFKTDLGPMESKELTVPLITKKEMVELPDWQNVSTDIQITGPGS